jgi:hypothetical protein
MGNTVQHEGFNEALVDRYINNKLADADKAAFEIEMMEDPALLQEVQMLDALKQNLRNAPAVIARPASAVILPFRAWLRQPMSLAASLLVAVLGFNAINQGAFNQVSRDESLPIGSVILLEESRGNSSAVFTGAPPYLFQIDVGFGNQAADFDVTVQNPADNAAVVQLDGLQADPDGWVRMVLDTPLMGDYEVVLNWTDGTGVEQVRRFPLTVSR